MAMRVRRPASPAELLARSTQLLECAGAEGELTWGLLCRLVEAPGSAGEELLLATVEGADGEPRVVATKTGPFPLVVVGDGEPSAEAVMALVDDLVEHGPAIDAVNGAERWSRAVAEGLARRTGRSSSASLRTIAHELHELVPPAQLPPGEASPARADELELLAGWAVAFGLEALGEDEPGHGNVDAARRTVTRGIAAGEVLVWRAPDGTPRSMCKVGRRTPRSTSIGLVYTPAADRGSGCASAVVAALTARELAAGCTWTSLFTDAANPTSNRIYRALGYEPRATFEIRRLA